MAEWFINTGPFLFNYRFWRNNNLFIYVYFIRGKEFLFLPEKRKDRVHPLPKCGKICYNILALLEGNRAGTHARQCARACLRERRAMPGALGEMQRRGARDA